MTELEQATTDFIKAVIKTGTEILGHPMFMFKIDATISTKTEDAERGKMISARIQEALTVANNANKPVTIEGMTAQ